MKEDMNEDEYNLCEQIENVIRDNKSVNDAEIAHVLSFLVSRHTCAK